MRFPREGNGRYGSSQNRKPGYFAPKYQPPFKKILPFVVPFSKTANLAAKIFKKHYIKLKNDDEFDVFDIDVITAYSRHKKYI